MTEGSTATDVVPAARTGARWAGRGLVLAGGLVAAVAGLFSIAAVIAAAFGSSSGWAGGALSALVLGVALGGLVAALGFRLLGVRRGRRAGLGALVGVLGVLAPWVAAALSARS